MGSANLLVHGSKETPPSGTFEYPEIRTSIGLCPPLWILDSSRRRQLAPSHYSEEGETILGRVSNRRDSQRCPIFDFQLLPKVGEVSVWNHLDRASRGCPRLRTMKSVSSCSERVATIVLVPTRGVTSKGTNGKLLAVVLPYPVGCTCPISKPLALDHTVDSN